MKQIFGNSWKLLTSKLHQPLPLNNRESQKLMTLLNDSFKRNLDRQYPPGLADSKHSPDDHFNALLRNPLFGSKKIRYASPSTRRAGDSQDAVPVRDLMFAAKEPVEYFKQQVATGVANMKSAKFALDSQKKKALASASIDAKDNMKSSEIGSIMLNWLWASGQYDRLDFLRDRDFVAQLIPFLVVEGQYRPIWEWLQRSRTVSISETPTHEAWVSLQKSIGTMVRHLVKSEANYGQGLQSAMQMFLTNYKALRLSVPESSFPTLSMNNLPAGAYLLSKWGSERLSTNLEPSIIDKFDISVVSWASPRLSAPFRALIQLLHPQKPNGPAVARLITGLESLVTNLSRTERIIVVRVGLKAVEVLLAQDSLKEAAQVMKALQTRFPSDVRAGDKSPKPRKAAEEAALRSLDTLLAT
ncbi:MAG: hypothetical protein LQ343_006876 [Gyalolechia ehrenbergii]|nr:MAG: hypothetical protein LQ343_006876 [Gyalolechia ehrenbergii]